MKIRHNIKANFTESENTFKIKLSDRFCSIFRLVISVTKILIYFKSSSSKLCSNYVERYCKKTYLYKNKPKYISIDYHIRNHHL